MQVKNKLSVFESDDYNSLLIEQKIAFHAVFKGDNALITGGGGVGKSHLIKILERHVKKLALTATTGIAAIDIRGQTLDRFMGFGSSIMSLDQARKLSPEVRERLSLVQTLLVDEASMLRIDKFEWMNVRLQAAKKNKKPFGGVQIILVGDFCQLIPIIGKNKTERDNIFLEYGRKLFCFESDVYDEAGFTPYLLSEYVRMGDETQRQLLRNIRMGAKILESVHSINEMAKGEVSDDALYLCTTNAHVDQINEVGYGKLKGKRKSFFGNIKKEFLTRPVAEAINLKDGCRVMLCANNPDADYYNGDLGTVISMKVNEVKVELDRGGIVTVLPYEWEEFSYKKEDNNLSKKATGTFEQMPLKLAYAITTHKSQGMTLDEVVIDFSGGNVSRSGTFAAGQAYVALSRVRSFNNMKLVKTLHRSDIKTDIRAVRFTAKVSIEALRRRDEDYDRFNIERLVA